MVRERVEGKVRHRSRLLQRLTLLLESRDDINISPPHPTGTGRGYPWAQWWLLRQELLICNIRPLGIHTMETYALLRVLVV